MIKGRTGHFTVPTGKRVMVHMNDGEKIIAKFKDSNNKIVRFFDHEPIAKIQVRTLSIYRGEL